MLRLLLGLLLISFVSLILLSFPKTPPERRLVRRIAYKPREPRVRVWPKPGRGKDIVIVIPYRDRKIHYERIMQNLRRIRRKTWTIHTILVEQFDTQPFKRAWLMNIGLAEAKKFFGEDTCLVTHDVDMLADALVDYSWCDRPTQICSELSCFGGGVPYASSAGGVVQASLRDWYKINGFTNEAVGWGGEDDDLHHRFRLNHLLTGGHLRRPEKGFGKCECMHDEHHTERTRDEHGYRHIVSKISRMRSNSDEWREDGLNSLKYSVEWKSLDEYGTLHLKVKKPVCQTEPKGKMWDAFRSMVGLLEDLGANYTVSSGTLLTWYRQCDLTSEDIDMNIDLRWFSAHLEDLHRSLKSAGWTKSAFFGKPNQIGYEEAWLYKGVKCDLFSIAYVEGRYINGLTIEGKVYPCDSYLERYERHEWNGVSFWTPAPIEPYLRGKYGRWRKKISSYRWDEDPFRRDGRRHCSRSEDISALQARFDLLPADSPTVRLAEE